MRRAATPGAGLRGLTSPCPDGTQRTLPPGEGGGRGREREKREYRVWYNESTAVNLSSLQVGSASVGWHPRGGRGGGREGGR